ncbi:MAG: stage II sporulation protein P [Clostridia bacterium]|jgi:stage II sporulation protein P|nr:stage II sporulation protein P [Clostridia bacterium]
MINFRVFRLGDVVKKLVKIGILIIGIIILTSFFNSIKKVNLQGFIENRKQQLENKTLIECLDDNLDKPYKNEEKQNLISKELDFIKSVFSSSVIAATEEENNDIKNNDEISNDVQVLPTTQVIQEHNKKDVYNVTYSNVQIRNQTSTELTQEMLTPDVSFNLNNMIIFHTHTSESYTPTEQYSYKSSGNFRTLDTRCSVVGLGDELSNRLLNKNINVIHNATFHDYPEYNGSYTRSAQTVQNILSGNVSDFVIDLHRDALADSTYAPSVMIGEEKAAQLMFVMGSNEGGLEHPNWNTNLKIAIKIQEKANEMYPGLFKPIMLTKYRYNQHLAKGSCIIEVGATGNTMEECLVSMKYFAEVLAAVNKEI